MPSARSIVFLIPSFQPTDILFGLIEELRRASAAPVVIVDDGSGAGYAPILNRVRQVANVTVLTNAVNLGKGSALKHGMNHILVHHPDCIGVVTADADGQHGVADILRVAEGLRSDPDRVAFGVRAFGTEVPLRSRFGNMVSHGVAVHLSLSHWTQSVGYADRLARNSEAADGSLPRYPGQPL